MKYLAVAIISILVCSPAYAVDPDQKMLPPTEKPHERPEPPAQPKPPSVDLSREVTVTGYELQALIRAAVIRAQSQAADQAAEAVNSKVQGALSKE